MPETFETRRDVLKPTMRPCAHRLELERGVGACITGIFRTLWGTQDQMAKTFGCTADNVRKHILNLLKDGGLDEKSTLEKHSEVQDEGGRKVTRQVDRYNRDVMLSVGYRVSSAKATAFRKWATGTLSDVIIKGYSVDRDRLENDPAARRSLTEMLLAIRSPDTGGLQ